MPSGLSSFYLSICHALQWDFCSHGYKLAAPSFAIVSKRERKGNGQKAKANKLIHLRLPFSTNFPGSPT